MNEITNPVDVGRRQPVAGRIRHAVRRRAQTWSWELHREIGLVGTLVGTLLGILLIPDNVDGGKQLQPAALVMALGLAAASFRTAFSSPAALFHPINLLAASPIYWLLLDPIQGIGDYGTVGGSDISKAFLMIGLFSGTVWVASFISPWPLPRIVKEAAMIQLSAKGLFGIGVVAFILAFQRFAIPSGYDLGSMMGAFSSSRWAAPWSRGALGGWDAFLDHIGYFGYLLAPITAFLARRLGFLNWRTLVMLALTVIILALFSTGGGRRIVGVMAGSGIVVWFLTAHPPRVKDLALLAVACACLLGFMQLMLEYRGVGIAAAFSKDTVIERSREHLAVDDNLLRLSQIIYIMPEHHAHVGSRWLVWVLARPVPRVFWPGKPLDPGFDLPSFQGMQGVSLSMSLVGELYMAWGLLGCFGGGVLLGILANTLAQLMRAGPKPGALITFGCGLLALFAGMRSGIDLILMSYAVLAWIGIAWVYRRTHPQHSGAVKLLRNRTS